MFSFKKTTNYSVYLRLLQYVKPFWSWFIISICGYAMFAYSQPLYAKIVEFFLKTLENSTNPMVLPLLGYLHTDKLIFFVPIFLLAVALFAGIGSFLGTYYLVKISMHVVFCLRKELFLRLLTLPCSYFDQQNSGYLLSKITYNTAQVTGAATEAIKVIVREGLTILFLFIYLVYTQWKLTLVFMILCPIIAIIVSWTGKKFRKMSHRIQDSMGEVTHITSETINNYRVVKSFCGEQYEYRRFAQACKNNLYQSLRMNRLNAIATPTLRFLVMTALASMMYIALQMKTSGSIGTSTAELVAFLTAAGMLPKPIRQLSEIYGEIQKGIAAAESIFALLDQPTEKNLGNIEIQRAVGHLELRNIYFTYPNTEKPILKNISFTLLPKKTIALVGKSGSGKSTLADLILRFYTPNSGEILLDGINIQKYQLHDFRQQISRVGQNTSLFSDSIYNNIIYNHANLNIDQQKISDVVQFSCLTDFTNSFAEGLNTQIGENGIKLSGGQCQRIAIARAIFKNAPIYIFDEATSALDNESEHLIKIAMDKIMQNCTTLVIAHRLSTVKNADLIIVLDDGEIAESGTHENLIKLNGIYSKLYNHFQNNN